MQSLAQFGDRLLVDFDPAVGLQVSGSAVTAAEDQVNGALAVVGAPQRLGAGWEDFPRITSRQTLPQASNADSGRGFTCTGLARDDSDGTWWACNDGRNLETGGSGGQVPSLVHLSGDGSASLGEVDLAALYPSMGTAQGVAVDTSDGTLWVCSPGENRVHHLSKAGADLAESITLTAPNGLAYDAVRDELYYCAADNNGLVVRINKAGAAQAAIDLSGDVIGIDIDHLHYPGGDELVVTFGANGFPGTVARFDISTPASPVLIESHDVTDAMAIEGVHYDGAGVYTLLNDGYFHGSAVANELFVVGVLGRPLAVQFIESNGVDALGIGQPQAVLDGFASSDFVVFAAVTYDGAGQVFSRAQNGSSREFQFMCNAGVFQATRGNTNPASSPGGVVTGGVYVASARVAGGLVYAGHSGAEGAGVAIDTYVEPNADVLIGARNNGTLGTYGFAGDCKVLRLVMVQGPLTAEERELIEGDLHWSYGVESRLPAEHPYRLAAPVFDTSPPYPAPGGFANHPAVRGTGEPRRRAFTSMSDPVPATRGTPEPPDYAGRGS